MKTHFYFFVLLKIEITVTLFALTFVLYIRTSFWLLFFIVGTLLLSLQKKYCSFIFWVVVGFLFVCDISSQAYRSYFG